MRMIMVNGYPGMGKTLFAEYCDKILKEKFEYCYILKTSVVDPIKKICSRMGWNGTKDDKGRKFLADVKDALDSYNNFTFENIDEWAKMPYDFIFIDARSGYDLDYAKEKYGAITVLIQQDKDIENYSNHADTEVEDYVYDYYIKNTGTKEDFYWTINLFLYDMMNNEKDFYGKEYYDRHSNKSSGAL